MAQPNIRKQGIVAGSIHVLVSKVRLIGAKALGNLGVKTWCIEVLRQTLGGSAG